MTLWSFPVVDIEVFCTNSIRESPYYIRLLSSLYWRACSLFGGVLSWCCKTCPSVRGDKCSVRASRTIHLLVAIAAQQSHSQSMTWSNNAIVKIYLASAKQTTALTVIGCGFEPFSASSLINDHTLCLHYKHEYRNAAVIHIRMP